MADVIHKGKSGYINNGDYITVSIGKKTLQRETDNASDDIDTTFVEALLTDRLDDVNYYNGGA